MTTTKLNLREISQLNVEIHGVPAADNYQGFKGLLNQKLPIRLKYWLNKLGEKTQSEQKTLEKLRNELIQKYGEEKDGNYSIPFLIEEGEGEEKKSVPNPNFEQFNKEMQGLLDQEHDLEHASFKLEEFAFEADESYPVFFKLISDAV